MRSSYPRCSYGTEELTIRQLVVAACVLTGLALTWQVRTHLPSRAEAFLVVFAVVGALVGAGIQYHTMIDQTRHWRSFGLTEAGTSSLDTAPPVPPELIDVARDVLRPGESWTLITDRGTCREFEYGLFWTAFHLLPNVVDCEDPDVELLVRVPPGDDVRVIGEGDRFWVVRR